MTAHALVCARDLRGGDVIFDPASQGRMIVSDAHVNERTDRVQLMYAGGGCTDVWTGFVVEHVGYDWQEEH